MFNKDKIRTAKMKKYIQKASKYNKRTARLLDKYEAMVRQSEIKRARREVAQKKTGTA